MAKLISWQWNIEADGVNVASPCSSGDLGQDYFVISGQVKGQVWVDGVEVRKMMKDKHSRLVRQFVALSPGTGHSLQAQLSIPNSPPSIKINVFAGLEKTMEIYAEIPATGTITLSVYRRTTISELEDEIRSNMHVSLGFFEIIFEGRTLETYRKLTLRDYGIGPYATVSIRPIDRFVGLLGDCAKIRLPYLVIKRGDLEVGPGGLIEQALGEDNGDYEWEIRPMKQLKIRIISPDSYRSITGSDPRSPQPSLERVAKIEPGQRNTENESLEIMSIAEHQDAAPATVAFRDGDQIMLMDYAVKIVRRTSSPENDEDTRSEHSFNNNAVKEDEKLLRGWLQLLSSHTFTFKTRLITTQHTTQQTTDTTDTMVNFTLPTLALLAMTPVIGAVAVPATTSAPSSASELAQQPTERFSFAQWVDDIIANRPHLSPAEAIEAFERTVLNATDGDALAKRAPRCNNIPGGEVPAPHAVECINHLAGRGSTPCVVTIKSRFATFGDAEIWGVGAGRATHSSSCEHVARAGGMIMDACWRADNTVQGDEFAWGNGNIDVHIVKKGLFTL
ncbi:hypothetical protein QBC40DRAFT_293742 [Triangularia verruculosa]|uniref:Ubiquitin-like domain-containing protein n=1 Tax=Triangularia verruculosa TaxID=2587418 RepID=A0AAN6XNF3_9PEZI|nr:hypothetical protein QBC40DRAFT_293742 [Triangularia verruculosa]